MPTLQRVCLPISVFLACTKYPPQFLLDMYSTKWCVLRHPLQERRAAHWNRSILRSIRTFLVSERDPNENVRAATHQNRSRQGAAQATKPMKNGIYNLVDLLQASPWSKLTQPHFKLLGNTVQCILFRKIAALVFIGVYDTMPWWEVHVSLSWRWHQVSCDVLCGQRLLCVCLGCS